MYDMQRIFRIFEINLISLQPPKVIYNEDRSLLQIPNCSTFDEDN
jgi:hypothetical protein